MPRFKMVNGERIQFTAEEEKARDIEEQAWADGAPARRMADLRDQRKKQEEVERINLVTIMFFRPYYIIYFLIF